MPETKGPTSIYPENAATSFPRPEPVYRAVEAWLRSMMGNPRQAQYPPSAEGHRAVEDARRPLNVGKGPSDGSTHSTAPMAWAWPSTGWSLGSYPAGTLRICPGPFVTEADIDRLVEGLDAAVLGEK